MSPKHASYTLPVGKIEVGKRHRKDLGDLTELAESIRTIGLLNPITVTNGNVLVAGRRRLEAAKLAGLANVHVRQIATLAEAEHALAAERDENLCRLDMKPSEWLSLGEALEALVKPESEEAQRAGQLRGGVARAAAALQSRDGKAPDGATIAERARDPRKRHESTTDARVGGQIGVSGTTYGRAKYVQASVKDPDPKVREAAQAGLAEMDRTGAVNPAYNAVRRARRKEAAPLPPESRFAGWDRNTDRFRSSVRKEQERAWSSIGALEAGTEYLAEKIDVPILVETMDPDDVEKIAVAAREARRRIGQFLKRLERAREYPNGKAKENGDSTRKEASRHA